MTKKDLIGLLAGIPDDAIVSIKKNADSEDDLAGYIEYSERRYPQKEIQHSVCICTRRWEKL